MKVRIKKLSGKAVMPRKAFPTDAGFDLVATKRWFDEYGNICYGTDLAFEIPEGYVGYIFPRSSNAKKDLSLSNAVGVIDAGYRGEVTFKFKPTLLVVDEYSLGKDESDYNGTITDTWDGQIVTFHGRSANYPDVHEDGVPFIPRMYAVGDRIGQLIIMPIPDIEFEEAEELTETDRGEGGYGSSGR